MDQVIDFVIEAQELLIGCEKKVRTNQDSSGEHVGTGNTVSILGDISCMLKNLGGVWSSSSSSKTEVFDRDPVS